MMFCSQIIRQFIRSAFESVNRLSFFCRLSLWFVVLGGSVFLLSHQLASRSEIFWVLIAPLAWLGSGGLRLFPRPKLNSKSRLGLFGAVAALILFPIGLNGFLVFATGSTWSWTEACITVLFFAIALETAILYSGCI